MFLISCAHTCVAVEMHVCVCMFLRMPSTMLAKVRSSLRNPQQPTRDFLACSGYGRLALAVGSTGVDACSALPEDLSAPGPALSLVGGFDSGIRDSKLCKL